MHFSLFIALCGASLVVVNRATILLDSQLPHSQVPRKVLRETQKALQKAHIISDTLDDFEPSCYLRVFYSSPNEEVFLGNKIKPSHTKRAPKIRILCAKSEVEKQSNSYTIALTDPDAPSRKDPKWSEMCHWIATVPANATTEEFYLDDQDQELKDVVEYKPPGPPPNTGYHRYVFVLLYGNNTNLTAPSDREHWGSGKEGHGVRDWATEAGLEVVGANFFYARNKKQ